VERKASIASAVATLAAAVVMIALATVWP